MLRGSPAEEGETRAGSWEEAALRAVELVGVLGASRQQPDGWGAQFSHLSQWLIYAGVIILRYKYYRSRQLLACGHSDQ